MPNTRITPEAQIALKDVRHNIYRKTRKDLTLQKIASCLIILAARDKHLIDELVKHDC